MKATAALALAAALSVSAAALRADRRSPQGLIGSLFPETQAYQSVDLHPPRLPALKASPAAARVEIAAQAAAPAPAPVAAFAAAPELASTAPDDLIAFNAGVPAPSLESAPQIALDSPHLNPMNVLDADARRPTRAPAGTGSGHAVGRADAKATCASACAKAGVKASNWHARVKAWTQNAYLNWGELPCSKPGAYRYEVVNNDDRPFTGVTIYDGEQRWQLGTIKPHQKIVISSQKPMGERPAIVFDRRFGSGDAL